MRTKKIEEPTYLQYKKYAKGDELNTYENNSDIKKTIFFWHGGNLNEYNEIIAQKSGRYEYGAGLYLTTKWEVASKYAKGSRKMYKVEVELGVDISDSNIDIDVLNEFIDKYVITAKRKEIKQRIEKYNKEGKVKGNIFNNIILNEKAIKSSNTYKLREFFVENGIDYEIVNNAFGWGEDMMVLYNMKKIVKTEIVSNKNKIEYYDLKPINDNRIKEFSYAKGGELKDVESTAKALEKINLYEINENFINDFQEKILEKFDEEKISNIQYLRHELHSESPKNIFYSESNDFDNKIEEVANNISELDITGKENEVSKKIMNFYDYESGNRKSESSFEYEEDMEHDDYYNLAYSEISEEKEKINKIIEEYLFDLDEIWDNYNLSEISDIRKNKTFAPSGYMRARSILGKESLSNIKYKKFDNKIIYKISEAYHSAKADGSNPKLVKEVEKVLSNNYAKGGELNTYKNKYNRKYGYPENESHNLEQISKDTGVSLKGLQQIYNKGIGAYKTNPESVRKNVNSKEQWAMGRVYSAVMGGKASKVDANELKMAKGGLLAPNGKASNLTAEQWKLVRTTAFKKFFGDWENDPENASKVVDENGEPLVVYRGFNKKNDKGFIFKYGVNRFSNRLANRFAHYFTRSKNVALEYAEQGQKQDEKDIIVKSYFLNSRELLDITIKNPKYPKFEEWVKTRESIFSYSPYAIIEKLKKREIPTHSYLFQSVLSKAVNEDDLDELSLLKIKELELKIKKDEKEQKNIYKSSQTITLIQLLSLITNKTLNEIIQRDFNENDAEARKYVYEWFINHKSDRKLVTDDLDVVLKNLIIDEGFDGGKFMEHQFGVKNEKDFEVYFVFDSEQIKLADGTNTTFDANNPDIRYEEGGEIQSMINEGIVEIEFYDTTIAHAKEYGIESKKPLYLKRIFVSENNRNKGLGKKLIKYLYDFAVENGNDVIFGHIATKSSYIEILKNLLLENGYTINDKNNDFYIMITKENKYNTGGDLKKSNIISLPDTYSSYDSLKPILENQGYELIKKNNLEMSTEKLEIEDNRSVSELDMKYPELPHSFINKQLMSGIEHEMEHTEDPRVAKKIAIDHLLENIHYYEYLAEMEQKMQGKNIDEHYESITKMYEEGGKVETFEFSTPTGKTSKLNYLQQVLVRTKAFKNFFGDWELAARNYQNGKLEFNEAYKNVSKCIDDSTLEPRVVYHGTQADKEFFTFDVTQEKKIGRPYAYFAYNREYSLNFSGGTNKGYMYAVFLNIRNPFNASGETFLKNRDSSYWLTSIKGQISLNKYGDVTKRKELSDTVDSQIKSYIEEVYTNQPYYFWLLMARDVNKEFKYFLMSHGYDGIFASENYTTPFDTENPSEFTYTYIAFDANQIKLADGRNIDFDPMNADIRYEEGGKTVEKVEVVVEQQEPTQNVSQIDYLRNNLRKFSQKDAEINKTIFKSGGHVQKDSGSPDDAKDGGLFVGRSHATGGIKAINLSTNQPIEVEGGEVIITKPAVEDQTKREFEGKMMTNKEILSHINQSGGGVSFEKGGEMGNSCGCSGKMYKFGGETISDYMVLRKISTIYDESIKNVKNYVDNLSEQFK
jgi:GNAT superfamily N-acetyltransferase